MPRAVLALAASLAAAAAAAQTSLAPPPAPPQAHPPAAAGSAPAAPREPGPSPSAEKPPLPRGAVLEEVSGTVLEIDRKTYRMVVDTLAGPVTIGLDRNTMVYTGGGLATVLDVKPGARVRAGRNADFLAYWVQVRSAAAQEPASTPGQGTGPAGGGSAPAGEAGGPGTGAAPPRGGEPGSAPSTVPGTPAR